MSGAVVPAAPSGATRTEYDSGQLYRQRLAVHLIGGGQAGRKSGTRPAPRPGPAVGTVAATRNRYSGLRPAPSTTRAQRSERAGDR